MPIYAYICDDCGFTKDVLQKISDTPLTVCLSCGKSSFRKTVTAPNFQLKGTGWYVTDFRNGSKSSGSDNSDSGSSGSGESNQLSDTSSSTTTTTPATSTSGNGETPSTTS